MRSIKVISLFISFVFCFSLHCQAQMSEQQQVDMVKYIDILNTFFKEVIIHYVDSVEIEKTAENAMNFTLQNMDPYSEYISAKDLPEFQIMTTGEYGGIGAVISMRENAIIIREPYEGMPAAEAGLIPGDCILSINGESIEGKDTQYASNLLKGQPNTPLSLTIQRIGEEQPRVIQTKRKRIHIDPIVYYGVLDNNIGYIRLASFTIESAQAVKETLSNLTKNHHITSLIFDVRDNGGGVVEECLSMLNYFLPKGDLLLSMKGKIKPYDKTFRASHSPIEPDLPLAILVNGNSASASEIIAGTIQDQDRGVIIGSRTFGKGLVQTTRSLPYGGQLKLTTAKYYIPSGRSIQKIDYSHRDENGQVNMIPDSLTTVYYTQNNRPVRDGGGILPDFVLEEKKVPTLIYYMELESIFFDFVTQWRAKNPVIASPATFQLTDEIYAEFKEFVQSKDFKYDLQSERNLEALKKSMEFERYMEVASDEFAALEKKLQPDLDRDLELHRDLISSYLSMHIMRQYYYIKGQLIYELRDDDAVKKAIEVLSNQNLYKDTLH